MDLNIQNWGYSLCVSAGFSPNTLRLKNSNCETPMLWYLLLNVFYQLFYNTLIQIINYVVYSTAGFHINIFL
jgi:hypothetical protein